MTTPAEYTRLAHLVKGWADRIDGTRWRIVSGVASEALEEVMEEMRAFSNGIVAIGPVLAADPLENKGMRAIVTCDRRDRHGQHNYQAATVFVCPGNDTPPMVPEEV